MSGFGPASPGSVLEQMLPGKLFFISLGLKFSIFLGLRNTLLFFWVSQVSIYFLGCKFCKWQCKNSFLGFLMSGSYFFGANLADIHFAVY